MTEENVVDFPTTAQKKEDPKEVDTSPEGLKKLAEENIPQILKLINKNRHEGVENLQRKTENLHQALKSLAEWAQEQQHPILKAQDNLGNTKFILDNELRSIDSALGSVLTVLEAQNSLLDMLINDTIGMIHNIQSTQQAVIIASGHSQTLIQLLLDRGDITEEEMKTTWQSIMTQNKEQIKRDPKESSPE